MTTNSSLRELGWKQNLLQRGESILFVSMNDMKYLSLACRVSSDTESVSLDDSSSLIQYTGFTSVVTDRELVQVSSSDYNSSLSMTSTAGATARIMFNGETF